MVRFDYMEINESNIEKLRASIRNIPNYIENELENLYESKYHPYTASIIIILKTKEYKEGKIFHSFVIPYNSKIIIYNI